MAAEVEKKVTTSGTSRMNEVVAIIIFALTVLLFLCLVSYNENDPSIFTVSSYETKNWIGVVGANIAVILFSFVGLTSYILPAVLALIGWRVFKSENLYLPIGRTFGFILFIFSFSGLLTYSLTTGFRGGMIGAIIVQFFLYLIGSIGSFILLLTLFLTSVLLITNLSYLTAVGDFQLAFDNFRLRFEEMFSGYKNWRETQKAEAQERLEKRLSRDDEKSLEEIKETPVISVGETVSNSNRKKKTAESFEKIKIPIDTVDDILELDEPIKEEEFRPKIIIGEEPSPTAITEDLVSPVKDISEKLEYSGFQDQAEILITPVKETDDLSLTNIGEIDDEASESLEESDEREFREESQKPQTYENYVLPTSDFLTPPSSRIEQKEDELLDIAKQLVEKSGEFNVNGRVTHITQGPVVTTYEFKPDAGVKYARITGLSDDLCLALKAESIRIDRIPGKAVVGIEVPNRERETIYLREVIESRKFRESTSLLSIALGKTIDGLNYSADLSKMPHLLMAGQTGAGKSVGVNSLIVSILYKAKPDEVKFIMVDPKQVELGIYADIPHLATPIIKDPKRAAAALKWAVGQMERRYKNLAGWGVRNIDGYNTEIKRRIENGELDDNGEKYQTLPYIVIIIDELADLMMVAGKEVEESITRLAQMARAVGIHLVLATQRPSVDVITGLIKANFPSRISFRVSQKVDSRTIIDSNGAESLLGRGDMLFLPPGTSNLIRVHGAFVDEKEIIKIVEHIKAQGNPDYDTSITKTDEELDDSGDLPGKKDPLFMDALRAVVGAKRASTSGLQRTLRIGYGRAAAILDAMVREGLIGEQDSGTRARPILEKAYEYLEAYDSADV